MPNDAPHSFNFSQKWTAPRATLRLSSAQPALRNVVFSWLTGTLACEDLLVFLPVLQHPEVDRRTLLNLVTILNESDCSTVSNPATGSKVTVVNLLTAPLHRLKGESYHRRIKHAQWSIQL